MLRQGGALRTLLVAFWLYRLRDAMLRGGVSFAAEVKAVNLRIAEHVFVIEPAIKPESRVISSNRFSIGEVERSLSLEPEVVYPLRPGETRGGSV
jgi:hypothetical protein